MDAIHIEKVVETYHASFKSFDDTLDAGFSDPDMPEFFQSDVVDHVWYYFDEEQPGRLAGFTLRAARRLLDNPEVKNEFVPILGDEAVVVLQGMIWEERSHSLTLEIPLTEAEFAGLQLARLALYERLNVIRTESARSAYSFAYSAETDTLNMNLERGEPENCFSGEVSEGFRLSFDADRPGRLVGLSINKASEFLATIESAKQLTTILGLEEVRALRDLIIDLAAYGEDDTFAMGHAHKPSVAKALKANHQRLNQILLAKEDKTTQS